MGEHRADRVLEMEIYPDVGGRRVTELLPTTHPVRLRKRRRRVPKVRDVRTPSPDSLRNRAVLQGIRTVYDQLIGVGDYLLDLKLRALLPRTQGVGSLGRPELHALNYEIAKLAGEIFDPKVALVAYERVNGIICRAFG
jgi:hypothetical protein